MARSSRPRRPVRPKAALAGSDRRGGIVLDPGPRSDPRGGAPRPTRCRRSPRRGRPATPQPGWRPGSSSTACSRGPTNPRRRSVRGHSAPGCSFATSRLPSTPRRSRWSMHAMPPSRWRRGCRWPKFDALWRGRCAAWRLPTTERRSRSPATLLEDLVAAGRLARDGDLLRDPTRSSGGLPPAVRAAMDRLEISLAIPAPPPLRRRGAGRPTARPRASGRSRPEVGSFASRRTSPGP